MALLHELEIKRIAIYPNSLISYCISNILFKFICFILYKRTLKYNGISLASYKMLLNDNSYFFSLSWRAQQTLFLSNARSSHFHIPPILQTNYAFHLPSTSFFHISPFPVTRIPLHLHVFLHLHNSLTSNPQACQMTRKL